MSRSKWAIILAFVLLVASGAALVEYFTHYASSMSIIVPDDYPTIQAAIGNATPGSTIHVRNGIYNELIVIDKPITLVGENREDTIINGHTLKYASIYNSRLYRRIMCKFEFQYHWKRLRNWNGQ